MRGFALIAVSVVLAIGVGTAVLATQSPSSRLQRYVDRYVSFAYPPAWTIVEETLLVQSSSFAVSALDLSNEVMGVPCTSAPTAVECHIPIRHLGPSGVLVSLEAADIPEHTIAAFAGKSMTLTGRRAKVSVVARKNCAFQATACFTATIERFGTPDVIVTNAYLRDPGIARERSQIDALVRVTSA